MEGTYSFDDLDKPSSYNDLLSGRIVRIGWKKLCKLHNYTPNNAKELTPSGFIAVTAAVNAEMKWHFIVAVSFNVC